MKMKHALCAAFGALALGLVATTAQAAPLAGLGAADAKAADSGVVEKATWYGDYGYRRDYGYDYDWRRRYRFGRFYYKPGFRYGFNDGYFGYGFHKFRGGRFHRGFRR